MFTLFFWWVKSLISLFKYRIAYFQDISRWTLKVLLRLMWAHKHSCEVDIIYGILKINVINFKRSKEKHFSEHESWGHTHIGIFMVGTFYSQNCSAMCIIIKYDEVEIILNFDLSECLWLYCYKHTLMCVLILFIY